MRWSSDGVSTRSSDSYSAMEAYATWPVRSFDPSTPQPGTTPADYRAGPSARPPMTKRRFTFKLESVRSVREHAEMAAMRDLAGELNQADTLRRELNSAHSR